MKIQIDHLSFNVNVDKNKIDRDLIPVIFLHGFTGSGSNWNFIFDRLPGNYLPIAVDLIGHGETDSPIDQKHYSTDSQIAQLKQIIAHFDSEKVILCGYSMGGRLALSFATAYPELISKLILESTSPGIKGDEERKTRSENDLNLAEQIENDGVEKFIEYWMNIPLFDSLKKLPAEKFEAIVKSKLNNKPIGLANSLRGFSTGLMPQLWDKLHELQFATLLITGSEDTKFTSLNEEMIRHLPYPTHKVISDCGHNVHLENPEEFIILVNQFIDK